MLVLATSTPVTETREETVQTAEAVETTEIVKDGDESKNEYPNLARVPCIRYFMTFRKKCVPISTLFDSGSEVNAIYSTFSWELGLPIRTIDVGAQKIDSTMLDTFKMVVVAFSVTDKANQVRFFKETFIVANVSPEIVLKMFFLTLSGADVNFLGRELRWSIYITKEALPTTRRIELVGKKEFAVATLDPESKTFIVYITLLSSDVSPSSSPLELDVYSSRKSQVSGLIAKEVFTKVPAKYSDFNDILSSDLASELLEHTRINDHAIELVDDQQPPCGPIYSLGPVKLETLKAYIETNQVNGFIRPSKSPARTPILFDWKSDGFFRLCVNYRGLNNLTMKNRYPLPLIGELLDRLRRAKQFTQLNLTSEYDRVRIRKENEWKTAFKTWYSYLEYQVMLFGLTNTPVSFQRYINKMLAEKLDIFVIVYLDDIPIYTENEEASHVTAVQWVLEQLKKFSLYANLKKCRFHQDEARFFGYVVSLKGIRMEDKQIKVVKQ